MEPTSTAPVIDQAAPKPADVKPTRHRNEFPDAYDAIEELERQEVAPAPAPKATPAKTSTPKPTPKPDAGKPEVAPAVAKPTPDKPAKVVDAKDPADVEKPADKAKEGQDVISEPDPTAKFTTAHDLRKDWRRLHRALQDKDLELNQLKEKVEKSPVTTAALEENKTLKKRLDEVEGELRYLDYTKSQDFKDKYEKPYQDAYGDAIEEVKELWVSTDDGNSRPATPGDFQKIMAADQQDVRALAAKLFGEASSDVLALRRKLVEMNKNANRESKRYREEAGERERQRTLKQSEEKSQLEGLWNKAVSTIEERYPEYFKPIEGDEEYNRELKAGYETVNKAHTPNLPMEEKIARLAALRHRAAAFRAQVFVNKRLKARVAELEGVVADYEKSAPTGGSGSSEASRTSNGSDHESAEAEIDRLAALDRTE
jgi:hypothetical protein